MHRLREWFGVKDWSGPQQNIQKTTQPPNTSNNETDQNKDIKTKAEDGTAKVPLSTRNLKTSPEKLKQVAVPDKRYSIFAKPEQWLKKFIPHKEGTCFGCKLVAMTTVLGYSVLSATVTATQYKQFNSNYKRLFVFTGVVGTIFGFSFLSILFYDQDPVEIFKPIVKTDVQNIKR